MKLFFNILIVAALSACQVPFDDGAIFKADSYVEQIPADKTAHIVLQNKKIGEKSLEYRQFLKKLTPVLAGKGYRLVDRDEKYAVILNLSFGTEKVSYIRERADFPDPVPPPVDAPVLSSMYYSYNIYSKFIRLTALDRHQNELWKVKVAKEDRREDFRSCEDELLFLTGKFIEKSSNRQIKGELSRGAFYQRNQRGLLPAETEESFYTPAGKRSDYEKALQKKINARQEDFERCGVKKRELVSVQVSAFGTLRGLKPVYSLTRSLDDKRFNCVAETLENLLDPLCLACSGEETFIVRVPYE